MHIITYAYYGWCSKHTIGADVPFGEAQQTEPVQTELLIRSPSSTEDFLF